MDYRKLFSGKDRFDSENFVCTCFRQGGEVHLTRSDDYPMLFVLVGGVRLNCPGRAAKTLLAGDMVIVDRNGISEMWCQDQTILMEYSLPQTLTAQFEQHPACFTQPCLPVVPITGRLESWVEARFQSSPDDTPSQDDGLVSLLFKYQRRRLKAIGTILKEYISGSC